MDNHQSIDEQIQHSTSDEIRKLLKAHFSQRVKLTEKQIRIAVGKIIEVGKSFWMNQLLSDHFSQRIQLTDKEIKDIVGKIMERRDYASTGSCVQKFFNKLNERQVNLIVKEADPNRMVLNYFSGELDFNQFQWIVEATHPLFVRPLWEGYCKYAPQVERAIVEKRLVEVEVRRLIAILQILSKKRVEWESVDIMLCTVTAMNSVAKYLQSSSWQELRYLCFDEDQCIIYLLHNQPSSMKVGDPFLS